jgi:hypothetical protein
MDTVFDAMDGAVDAAAEAARKAVPTDDKAFATRVLEAAALPRAEYERVRVDLARELRVRVSVLDGMVKAARLASG